MDEILIEGKTVEESKEITKMGVNEVGMVVAKSHDEVMRIATAMFKSGTVPSTLKNPMQVFAIIQYGAELGLKTGESLRNIGLVRGKPTLHTDGPMTVVRRSGQLEAESGYYFDKDGKKIDLEKEPHKIGQLFGYSATLKRKGFDSVTRVYTLEQAKNAGLVKGDSAWAKHPDDMLYRRATLKAARVAFTDCLGSVDLDQYNVKGARDVTPDKKRQDELNKFIEEDRNEST